MPRSTIDAVGSNARCGSDVLIVNELSITSVEPAAFWLVAAIAAAAHASAASAASGTLTRQRRAGRRLTWELLLLSAGFGFPPYSTPPVRASWAGGRPASCSQHAAARSPASESSGGSSTGQRANAYGQRGWKRQPVGGCAGSGTSPGRASGSVPAPSARGTAAISASL